MKNYANTMAMDVAFDYLGGLTHGEEEAIRMTMTLLECDRQEAEVAFEQCKATIINSAY